MSRSPDISVRRVAISMTTGQSEPIAALRSWSPAGLMQ